jgi:hypothetical protein
MHLVIGTLAKDRAWLLPEWFEAIEEQEIDPTILCVYSKSEDNTREILEEHGVSIIEDSRPGRPVHEIDGHMWGDHATYAYMADMRNRLLWSAFALGADYFFSLDTDIILPKDAILSMLRFAESHPGVIAPAVNMGTNNVSWNKMDWVDKGHPGMAYRGMSLGETVRGQADVIMAAMLMDSDTMQQVKWEPHVQGEDVGFCVNAAEKQVPLWWLPEIRCEHRMRRY